MAASDLHKPRGNPYDYMRPVPTRDLFAGRATEIGIVMTEIRRLKEVPSTPPVVGLTGERRVGKTSLLIRIEELCAEQEILTARLSTTESMVRDPWDFWLLVFQCIAETLRAHSIDLDQPRPLGFRDITQVDIPSLLFSSYYAGQRLLGSPLSPLVVSKDLKTIADQVRGKGYSGIILMLDEAHLLVDLNDIQQQLRDSIAESQGFGIVFAGEPSLGRMFNDISNRFFHQGTVVQVSNFIEPNDVAECAIKPLTPEERLLMSPMTVDYLAMLSQGKPNQIRLICSTIYSDYVTGKQNDLNISIATLDTVLQVIASIYTEYDLKKLVDKINTLPAVQLEILYRITRYPNWSVDQVIDLDESFRGETKSGLADKRRRKTLLDKRSGFIRDGLLADVPDRCILAGDEFTYLYIRFLYEVRKYGNIRKRLELGKGKATPFEEKVDKLALSLSFELGRIPRITNLTTYDHNVETDDISSGADKRFRVLGGLVSHEKFDSLGISPAESLHIMDQCIKTCQLVEETGPHHYISILVRNSLNVNEIVHVELYFDPAKVVQLMSPNTEGLLKQQAEAAGVWIELISDRNIALLPTLPDFVQSLGASSLDDAFKDASEVAMWKLKSVQHIVTGPRASANDSEKKTTLKEDEGGWADKYRAGDETGAISILDKLIADCISAKDNVGLAEYYNDRGYIKTAPRVNKIEEAAKDLERAIAYHYRHLELPLLDLAVIKIDQKAYPAAVSHMEDALFLATARESIVATFLRLRLPTHPSAPIAKMEQTPANVIEAAYINLAYVYVQTDQIASALETVEEGLALFPNSFRLKHSKARIHLFTKKAILANDIYEELNKIEIPDPVLAKEIADYVKRFVVPKHRRKSRH